MIQEKNKTMVFEVESDNWTQEKIDAIIDAIDSMSATVVDEYSKSDDEILYDALTKEIAWQWIIYMQY